MGHFFKMNSDIYFFLPKIEISSVYQRIRPLMWASLCFFFLEDFFFSWGFLFEYRQFQQYVLTPSGSSLTKCLYLTLAKIVFYGILHIIHTSYVGIYLFYSLVQIRDRFIKLYTIHSVKTFIKKKTYFYFAFNKFWTMAFTCARKYRKKK